LTDIDIIMSVCCSVMKISLIYINIIICSNSILITLSCFCFRKAWCI